MNDREILNKSFLEAIQAKLPENKTSLVNTFMDILNIEKEAAYRRIRGEVPFTFLEVAIISNQIGVSLDAVCSILSPKTYLFHLDTIHSSDLNDADNAIPEFTGSFLKSICGSVSSEMIESTNTIPLVLYQKYEQLSKLYLLKCLYQSGNTKCIKEFSDIHLTDSFKENQKRYVSALKDVKDTCYIVDPLFMKYLVNDILYFFNIRLINKEGVEQLRDELLDLLNDMETLSVKGTYDTTKSKVRMYISGVNFNTGCSCVEFDNAQMNRISLFAFNQLVSFNTSVGEKIKTWLFALLKTSTEISVSGEIQRILFFEEQRKIIEDLSLQE